MTQLEELSGSSFFFPEGRTYSPPRRRKLHILRPAASGRAHPFRCSSSPHKAALCGGPFGGGIPPSGRERALSEGPRFLREAAGCSLLACAAARAFRRDEFAGQYRASSTRLLPTQALFGSGGGHSPQETKQGGDEACRFTTWNRRSSAGEQDAPLWRRPPI